jgi:hypothetical protein
MTPKSKLEMTMPMKSAPKVLPRDGGARTGEVAIFSDSTLPSGRACASQAKGLKDRSELV